MTPSALPGLFPALLPALFPTLLLAALPAPLRASDDASGGASRSGLSEVGAPPPFVRFAAVGALDDRAEAGRRVRDRVRSWMPGFVIALGEGGFPGSPVESHGLPWREGRSEFRRGPVHVFLLAGEGARREADAEWLRKALLASAAPWKVVCLPRAPYSSHQGPGTESPWRWPFRQWGADAVIAGRDGHYERLEVDGIPYFVNGLEGKPAPERRPGSQCVFDEDLGAMLVEAGAERIDFRFVTSEGLVVDALSLRRGGVASGAGRPGRGSAAVPAAISR
jgi:hypothetical protein